jgi:DNA ligase (NAD+)
VDEIGDKIAQSVIDYFNVEANRLEVQRLIDLGLQMEAEERESLISNALEGKKLVVSGVFETYSRNDLKKEIELHGGKNVSSISAKTDYVVAGENMGPAKLEKAQKLGVTILSEQEFIALING